MSYLSYIKYNPIHDTIQTQMCECDSPMLFPDRHIVLSPLTPVKSILFKARLVVFTARGHSLCVFAVEMLNHNSLLCNRKSVQMNLMSIDYMQTETEKHIPKDMKTHLWTYLRHLVSINTNLQSPVKL